MSTQIISASYNDALTVNFTNDAWFNATTVAKYFGKLSNEWLRLDSTKEYIACLEEFQLRENPANEEIQLFKTKRGQSVNGGGTWFHPKLAIAFARWLDVRFAVWCDMQIEKILRPLPYGLKHIPPSPYISESEASQFKKSLEQHCKGERQQYSLLYRKVYDYYGVTSYKHIPVGKLPEAARLIGIKLVAVKKPKLPPEPQLICMTPMELLAHDEQVANEAIKQVQGELVSEPSQDGVMLFLKNHSEKERRFLVHTKMNAAQITPVADDCYVMTEDEIIRHFADKKGVLMIDKNRLDEITLKQLGKFLA